jgi:hypothetical protein
MGLSVEILNEKKYVRRSHQFNFGLIATYEQYSDKDKRQVFEQLLRKIAAFLTIMEVDHDMLWDQQKKRYMKDFVANVYERLNAGEVVGRGSFCIPFDHLNAFNF